MATRRKRTSYTTTATTARRAVLYARFSSDMQRDSWSIEAQVADLRAYCERMGWDVLPELCRDDAVSGKLDTDARPGLERAMTLIREGKANVLVVHKIDRFFRNVEKTFRYVNELEELGAGVVCTQQPINTLDPMSGKIVLAVMAALAESYLDNLSDETSKGKRARATAGLPNGDLPYGYRNPEQGTSGTNNRTVPVIVPEEAEAVRLAFSLYASGHHSDARVAQALNAQGWRMRSKRHPDGYPFTKDTLTAMLDNPFYAGWVTLTAGGATKRADDAQRMQGQHAPIISQDLFDRAVAVRASKRGMGRRGSPTRQSYVYVASGLIQCIHCRQNLRAQGTGSRKATYRDASRDRGIACTARRSSIPATMIDEGLLAAVSGLQLPDEWQALVLAQVDTSADDTARVDARRAALTRQLARLKRLLLDGDIDQVEYRTEKARIEADLAQLQPSAQSVDLERAAALLRELRELWLHATPQEQRDIVRQLFEAIYCDLDSRRVVAVQLKRALLPLKSALPKCTQCGSDGHRYSIPYIGSPGEVDAIVRAA